MGLMLFCWTPLVVGMAWVMEPVGVPADDALCATTVLASKERRRVVESMMKERVCTLF